MHHSHLYGHLLTVVDVETTGVIPNYHEIIQIACVPLDENYNPSKRYRHFYLDGIAPDHPERMGRDAKLKNHLDPYKLAEEYVSQSRAADLLEEWFLSLALPADKRLVPLAHNWPFERSMLQAWLGPDSFNTLWDGRARDTQCSVALINDIHSWQGNEVPFSSISLISCCNRLGIELDNAHNALADCIATAKVYRELIRLFG